MGEMEIAPDGEMDIGEMDIARDGDGEMDIPPDNMSCRGRDGHSTRGRHGHERAGHSTR